jgi:hypothetical protein
MKTPDEIAAFKLEIAAVCQRHRMGMMGTCESEGIRGEILLFDMDDPPPTPEASWALRWWQNDRDHHLMWLD